MAATERAVIVRACKYDGSEHRRWPAQLLKRAGSLIVLDAYFSEEISHSLLGTIPIGTHSLEYYWLDRWYNVFRFTLPGGQLKNYYCNVNVPPTLEDGILNYIDLDLDILVEPDASFQILDVDDFERNAQRYDYSVEARANAAQALDDLVRMIKTHEFPFSF